jgi:hypothetical protein
LLESLADPGGIRVSGTVHEHIGNKLALGYEDLGEQSVKNIASRHEYSGCGRGPAQRSLGRPKKLSDDICGEAPSRSLAPAIIFGTIVLVQHLSLRPPSI